MANRYDTKGNTEGLYQPGSGDTVLLNKLGIIDSSEMDDVELSLLDGFQTSLFERVEIDQRLTSKELCRWHKDWLFAVYKWAGRYRTVNMQKDGFPFAAAQRIPLLMQEFDANFLAHFTPCNQMNEDQLLEALSLCHIEYIVIHPFREGNGRLSRVLATVMTLQAGLPPLDFSLMAEQRRDYFAAIQQGHAGNYEPIKQIFSRVLQASRNAG